MGNAASPSRTLATKSAPTVETTECSYVALPSSNAVISHTQVYPVLTDVPAVAEEKDPDEVWWKQVALPILQARRADVDAHSDLVQMLQTLITQGEAAYSRVQRVLHHTGHVCLWVDIANCPACQTRIYARATPVTKPPGFLWDLLKYLIQYGRSQWMEQEHLRYPCTNKTVCNAAALPHLWIIRFLQLMINHRHLSWKTYIEMVNLVVDQHAAVMPSLPGFASTWETLLYQFSQTRQVTLGTREEFDRLVVRLMDLGWIDPNALKTQDCVGYCLLVRSFMQMVVRKTVFHFNVDGARIIHIPIAFLEGMKVPQEQPQTMMQVFLDLLQVPENVESCQRMWTYAEKRAASAEERPTRYILDPVHKIWSLEWHPLFLRMLEFHTSLWAFLFMHDLPLCVQMLQRAEYLPGFYTHIRALRKTAVLQPKLEADFDAQLLVVLKWLALHEQPDLLRALASNLTLRREHLMILHSDYASAAVKPFIRSLLDASADSGSPSSSASAVQ